PGGGGRPVDLERPQAQPAALERAAGEVEVEARELAAERLGAPAPARAVQAAEGLEVRLEPLRILREAEGDLVLARQLALAGPQDRAPSPALAAAPPPHPLAAGPDRPPPRLRPLPGPEHVPRALRKALPRLARLIQQGMQPDGQIDESRLAASRCTFGAGHR